MLAHLIFRHKGSLNSDKSKVLIIFGDASETIDTMSPYIRLIEGGLEPVMAAPEQCEYPNGYASGLKQGWTITP
jgi:protease I